MNPVTLFRYGALLCFVAFTTLLQSNLVAADKLAAVYVYALSDAPARSWKPIFCDDILVAKLKRGTFFVLNVAPGRHLLRSADSAPALVDARPGVDSFVRLSSQFTVGEPAVSLLETVPGVVARNDLRFVVYIDQKQVLSNSVSRTDPSPPKHLGLRRREPN